MATLTTANHNINRMLNDSHDGKEFKLPNVDLEFIRDKDLQWWIKVEYWDMNFKMKLEFDDD